MFKKISILGLFLILILSGCLEKQFEAPQQQTESLDAKTQELLENVDKKGGENLTAEEIAALEKVEQNFENAEAAKIADEYNMVTGLEDLEDAKKDGSAARGSCNAIAEGSTCLEYVGSMWTEQQMRLNCSDSGTFSLEACPDDMAGGCNVGAGTISDMISWFYYRGDGEITPESLFSAQQVCNMNPMGKWIVK